MARIKRKRGEYRSGFEQTVKRLLEESVIPFGYEDVKLEYTVPATVHKYTPDLTFRDKHDNIIIYIECKGRFTAADRKKMLLVKDQHPDKKIKLLFQKSNNTITRTSKTTYSMWAEKNGFEWAEGPEIPKQWLKGVKK